MRKAQKRRIKRDQRRARPERWVVEREMLQWSWFPHCDFKSLMLTEGPEWKELILTWVKWKQYKDISDAFKEAKYLVTYYPTEQVRIHDVMTDTILPMELV